MPNLEPKSAPALLFAAAGSLLGASVAEAAPYNEDVSAPGGDFGNSFAGRTTLTLGTDFVSGNVEGGTDPDFYTYTGLLGGGQFTLEITAGDGSNYFGSFTTRDDNNVQIGNTADYSGEPAGTQQFITGIVPANGNLTVAIQQGSESGSPGYTTALAVVPEPATTTLALLGGVVAALVARRRAKGRACTSSKES